MDGLDHSRRVLWRDAGMDTVSQVEHVAIACTETCQDFSDLFANMLR